MNECCLRYISQCIRDQLQIENPYIVIWKSSSCGGNPTETKVIKTIYEAHNNHELEAQFLMVLKTDRLNTNQANHLCILDHNVYKMIMF